MEWFTAWSLLDMVSVRGLGIGSLSEAVGHLYIVWIQLEEISELFLQMFISHRDKKMKKKLNVWHRNI